jgi:hypothetical protein
MSEELLFLSRISKNSFIRSRKMPFHAMVVFIINFTKKSLQLELNSFANLFDSNPRITKQAFSKSRQNLSPEAFRLLNEKLVVEIYSDNEINTFKGFRVFGIDGLSLRLPASQELYQEYGSNVSQNSVPLAIASVIYDSLNHIAIHATLQPRLTSERSMAIENILALCRFDTLTKDSYAGDIILFDRGYPWLFLMLFIRHKNKHFVMRAARQFLSEVKVAVKAGVRDTIITIPAFKEGRVLYPEFAQYLPHLEKDTFIKIRVLLYDLPSGEKEIILTSLIDSDQFSYDDFFTLYGLRWQNEEAYKLYKCIAEIENFSGKSKITIEQDFYAAIFACNTASILMQEAQAEVEKERSIDIENNDKDQCKYVYKINRNVLIGSMKDEIVQVLLSDCDLNAYCEDFKKRIKKSLVPIRPNRSFPRNSRRREKPAKRRAL